MTFSQWHQVSWQNSIVLITPDSVTVLHVEAACLKEDGYFTYQSLDWDKMLEKALCKNANRLFATIRCESI